jgi:hypothetical protein
MKELVKTLDQLIGELYLIKTNTKTHERTNCNPGGAKGSKESV